MDPRKEYPGHAWPKKKELINESLAALTKVILILIDDGYLVPIIPHEKLDASETTYEGLMYLRDSAQAIEAILIDGPMKEE